MSFLGPSPSLQEQHSWWIEVWNNFFFFFWRKKGYLQPKLSICILFEQRDKTRIIHLQPRLTTLKNTVLYTNFVSLHVAHLIGFRAKQRTEKNRVCCVRICTEVCKGSQRKNDSHTGKNSTCSHPNYVSLSGWKQLMHWFPWEYFHPEQYSHLKPLPWVCPIYNYVCIECCLPTSAEPGAEWPLLHHPQTSALLWFLKEIKGN